jgi:hypothetical protein
MATMNDVLHSTLTKSRRKLMMASIKSNAYVAWQFAGGRVETQDGGWEITNPLITGRNPNVTSYQYFDPLPVDQTDEFNTLKYSFARVAGTVVISDQQMDENRGPSAVFNLLKAKMQVLEESIKEMYSSYLYGSGAGTDPNGLPVLIPDDPTTGSVGSISRVTETQVRSSSYDFAGTLNEANIEEAYDAILLDLKQKSSRPAICVAGRNQYQLYRAAVRDKITLDIGATNTGRRMIDLGFEGVRHQGVTFLFDEDCPVDKSYWIDDSSIRVHFLKGVNMRVKNLLAPWDVDAVGKRVVSQWQLCGWKFYRTHAVVND